MSSLIAWWDFEEPVGSAQWDAHNADPAFQLDSGGDTSYASGEIPKTGSGHVNHDGASDLETPSLAANGTLNFTGSFSFTGWFRPEGTIPATSADQGTVVAKWRASTGERSYWIGYYDSVGFVFNTQNDQNVSISVVSYAALEVGKYYFIAVWLDTERSVIGIQVDDVVAEESFSGTLSQSTTVPFALYRIGGGSGWASVNIGSGSLDALNVWSRALTRTERDILRHDGKGWTFETWPGFIETDEQKFQATYANASAADPKPTALIRPADVQRSIDTDVANLANGPNLYTVEVIFDVGELQHLNPFNATTGKPRVFFVKDDQPGLRQGKNLLLKSYQIRDADPSVPVTCTFWG